MAKKTQDYSEARFWAISELGYGRGFSVEEAVANHDEQVGWDYGTRLKVLSFKIEEVGLVVWESGDDVDGFAGGSWTADGEVVREFEVDEIRAYRNQPVWWVDEFGDWARAL